MNARKSLVKVLGPVLLLTASLALPADTMAAPGHGRQAAHAKAENHKKQNENRGQQRQQQGRAARQRQVRQERQRAPQHQRHQQVARQHVARQKVVKQKVVKQKAARPVVQQRQTRAQRQLQTRQLERQLQLQRQSQVRAQQQRQLALQRQAELRRQSQIRQRNTSRNGSRYVYRNGSRYYYRQPQPYRSGGRRGGGGADPNVIDIDGYLNSEGRECMTLRGHDGRLWSLAGGTYGLQPGEHVRLVGRIVDGGACGWQGTAFDIYEVTTVWADDRHRTTYYDHLYDGPFDQLGRSDDRYYDDQYDPYNGADIPYHN